MWCLLLTIKSTKVLMPWWWLQRPGTQSHNCTLITTLDCMQLLTCNSSNHCSQTALCVLSRTVGVFYVHRIERNQWACAKSGLVSEKKRSFKQLPRAKAAKHQCACSRDFMRVAIYLVVQINFSGIKVVHCGQLNVHWNLNRWQLRMPSRWTNHTITHKSRFKSKI